MVEGFNLSSKRIWLSPKGHITDTDFDIGDECVIREYNVKEFISRLLLHTDYKLPKLEGKSINEPKFSAKQVNEIIQEFKDSMSDTIKRLAGKYLINNQKEE